MLSTAPPPDFLPSDPVSPSRSTVAFVLALLLGVGWSLGPRSAAAQDGDGLIVPVDSSFQTLASNDDGFTDQIPLGFDFNFYGTVQNAVYINNNGSVSFGSEVAAFTPEGFPLSDTLMIAPFWADVDTRPDGSGLVRYKADTANQRLIVTWDGVGYYNQQTDKLNTFQVVLSTRQDPITTQGKNACFAYEDMQWTTGSASGGTDGFGGTPATVGVNKGDGQTFALIGRFSQSGDSYDGPGGTEDGVDYLDGQRFCFDTSQSTNLPPLTSAFPETDTLAALTGQTLRDTVQFIGPEANQTVDPSVSANIPNFTTDLTTGNPAEIAFAFSPDSTQEGNLYDVTFSGTDDGTPAATSAETLTVAVSRPPDISLGEPDTPPTPNSPVSVDIQLPADFTPVEGTLFYREAGRRTFQRRTLDLSGLEPGTATTVPAEIPPEVVTKQGVQYYAQFRGPLSDGASTARANVDGASTVRVNVPSGAPTAPAFLPTRFDAVQARGTFAPRSYRMLTVPAALGDRTVLDVLEAQYGAYDPSSWRLARWRPQSETYRFGREIDRLRPGQAAWLITESGDSLTVRDGRSIDASTPRSLSLPPGWNQIGSPFPFPVAWAEVSGTEAVRQPMVYDTTAASGYADAAVLRPWRGYFVFNPQDTTVALQVPPVGVPDEQSALARQSRTDADSGTGTYRLRAAAVAPSDASDERVVTLGFGGQSRRGLGPDDRAQPPAIDPSVHLYAAPDEGPALLRSLKPAASDGAVWTLALRRPEGDPSPVTVRLREQGTRPSDHRLYVLDSDRDRRLPITNGSVTVPKVGSESARHLRVIVGTKAFAERESGDAPLTIQETKLRPPAPNPLTTSTTISYQLSEAADVTIAVYDVLGRRVRTLVSSRREAGVHEFQWRPNRDGALASGVYFCRMRAGDVTDTRRLVVVR